METSISTPRAPDQLVRKKLTNSLITILWWVGIWGLSETLLTVLVKNSIFYRFAIYLGMIGFVFLMILLSPEIVENF